MVQAYFGGRVVSAVVPSHSDEADAGDSQDTNTTQYELMRAIAVNRCVTIVGDPDQSSAYMGEARLLSLN